MVNLYNRFGPPPPREFASACGLTVVVVANTPYLAAPVIDSLPTELPYDLVGRRDILILRHSKRFLQYFHNDLSLEENNKADFVRTIRGLVCTNSNVFLIPVDDSAIRIVNSTFDQLGASCYPIPQSSSFEMLNDKWRFSQYCSKLGVRVPTAIRLTDKAEVDFDYVSATFGLPFVIKPTNKSDSQGLCVVCSKKQLHKEILSNRKYNFSPLIAQTFIPGVDIDISILADRGYIKHFAVQIRNERMLCFVQNEELVKFTEVLVRDLCYTGVIHFDARLHDASQEVFLVEANPRFWGSMGEATLGGLNFVRAGMYAFLGSESADPTTIFDVTVQSVRVRSLLYEIAMGRRSHLQLSQRQRLRIRDAIRSPLHSLSF
jgi:predicted ATP-grasp superfamily ATP-dependent carboligase